MKSPINIDDLKLKWDPASTNTKPQHETMSEKVYLEPYFQFLIETAPASSINTSKTYGPIDKVFELL